MISKYEVTINEDKTIVEACKQSSAMGKAFHQYMKSNKLQKEDKVVLQITSERTEEVVGVKESEEEKVDLKKAQEEVDKARVVIQEGEKGKEIKEEVKE